jgi:hypothetical protein
MKIKTFAITADWNKKASIFYILIPKRRYIDDSRKAEAAPDHERQEARELYGF